MEYLSTEYIDSDDEEESMPRHAYHPAAGSTRSSQVCSGPLSRSLLELAGSRKTSSPGVIDSISGPGRGRMGNLSLKEITEERRQYVGSKRSFLDTSEEDEDAGENLAGMSLDDIIKLRKIKAPPKTYDNSAWNKWKKTKNKEAAWLDQNSNHCFSEQVQLDSGVSRNVGRMDHRDLSAEYESQHPPRKKLKEQVNSVIKVTPESGIRLLLEQGFVIGVRVYELVSEDDENIRYRRWRAEYFDGRDESLWGVGEGSSKLLARECAALNFLEYLRAACPNVKIPVCEVPLGARISHSVVKAAENLLQKLAPNLGDPLFAEELVMKNGREKNRYSYYIGNHAFHGTSYNLKYAKYIAAKKVYDTLSGSGEVFGLEPIIKGEQCSDGSQYQLVDTEEIHIVKGQKSPAKKSTEPSYVYTPVPGGKFKGPILVSPASEYRMSPNLMQIRKFLEIQKYGADNHVPADSPEQAASTSESTFTPKRKNNGRTQREPLRATEAIRPPVVKTTRSAPPPPSAASTTFDTTNQSSFVVGTSAAKPTQPRKVTRTGAGRTTQTTTSNMYSVDEIAVLWNYGLRDRVMTSLEQWRNIPSNDGAMVQDDSKFSEQENISRLTVAAYAELASFKLANYRVKLNLAQGIQNVAEKFRRCTSVPKSSVGSNRSGSAQSRGGSGRRANPFR